MKHLLFQIKMFSLSIFIVYILISHGFSTETSQPARYCIPSSSGVPICFYLYSDYYTFHDATQLCSQDGATLHAPQNEAENLVVRDWLTHQGVFSVWLGFEEIHYNWSQVVEVPFSAWQYDWPPDDDVTNYESCVHLNPEADYGWSQAKCRDRKSFICLIEDLEQCSPGRDVLVSKDSQSCYAIHRTKLSWHEAYKKCVSLGQRLLQIKDKYEHIHLANMLEAMEEKEDIWLGYTNRKWETYPGGEDQTFFQWAEGQPNTADQTCALALDDGTWMDRSCEEKHRVVCSAECASGTKGIRNCLALADGHYHSCIACDVFCSCVDGNIVDGRQCPLGTDGSKTLWNDSQKKCEYTSESCQVFVNQTIIPTTTIAPIPTSDFSKHVTFTTSSSSPVSTAQAMVTTTKLTSLVTLNPKVKVTDGNGLEIDVAGRREGIKTSYVTPLIGVGVAVVVIVILVAALAVGLYRTRVKRAEKEKALRIRQSQQSLRTPNDADSEHSDVDFTQARRYHNDTMGYSDDPTRQWTWRRADGLPRYADHLPSGPEAKNI